MTRKYAPPAKNTNYNIFAYCLFADQKRRLWTESCGTEETMNYPTLACSCLALASASFFSRLSIISASLS